MLPFPIWQTTEKRSSFLFEHNTLIELSYIERALIAFRLPGASAKQDKQLACSGGCETPRPPGDVHLPSSVREAERGGDVLSCPAVWGRVWAGVEEWVSACRGG